MAILSRIRVHPIKSLDPVDRERVRVSAAGGLEGDRAYAIVDEEGEYVNGKRTAAVHRLRSTVDVDGGTVSLDVEGAAGAGFSGSSTVPERFDLEDEREALAEWLSAYFGRRVSLATADGGELTDSAVFGGGPPGATVVSTATLREVASWFPDVDEESVRDRFRTNLEVDGVEPFWEDGLVAGAGGAANGRRFQIGDVTFEPVEPVPRCVVPTRDPATGETTDGFRERFVERRRETIEAAPDPTAFDHAYALTVLARPLEADRGETISVGDAVRVLD